MVPFQLGTALLPGTEFAPLPGSVVIDSLGSGSVGNGNVPPRVILIDGIVKLTPGTVVLFRFGNSFPLVSGPVAKVSLGKG